MKKKLRMLALSMAMVMTVTACQGGGSSTASNKAASGKANSGSAGSSANEVAKEGFPIVKDTINFTAVGYGEPGCGEWEDYPIFKEIEKNCNIDVPGQP